MTSNAILESGVAHDIVPRARHVAGRAVNRQEVSVIRGGFVPEDVGLLGHL